MALDRDNLTPFKRSLVELALILCMGIAFLIYLHYRGASANTVWLVMTWLAGLLLLWSVVAVVDLIVRHHHSTHPPRPKGSKRPARKVVRIPLTGSHPHVLLRQEKHPGHGRRAAR